MLTMYRFAPFVYDVWRSPEVLSIVSKIAGVEVVPQMDFEIAHINISISSKEQQAEAQRILTEHANRVADEGVSGCPWEDDAPIVDWHTDSYPFVCVTMLSDCTDMVGGETALRTGTGEIKKVRGPQMVCPPLRRPFTANKLPGQCCRPSRTIHRTPSHACSWLLRTNHDGHILPSQVSIHQRRHGPDHCQSCLRLV